MRNIYHFDEQPNRVISD
uniref:Uncharacterized protein n=1 Tax=Rhizophora mucronata TaxID=61149 RepID=A0A2P2PFR0_RHIMU